MVAAIQFRGEVTGPQRLRTRLHARQSFGHVYEMARRLRIQPWGQVPQMRRDKLMELLLYLPRESRFVAGILKHRMTS